jgi:hypothetical protein
MGVDGDYVDRAALEIPDKNFWAHDIRAPLSLGRRFDLVECLEVAEHIEEDAADSVVELLAAHGDAILFSAAIPYQGGVHHVNEQWPSYWAKKFATFGYSVNDVIRPRIWDDVTIEVWYRQNILLFLRGPCETEAVAGIVDVVHPEMWRDRNGTLRQMAAHKPGLREVVRPLPGAVGAAVRYRIRTFLHQDR